MPTISEFYGISICMYFEDHPPPHFHVFYAEQEAQASLPAPIDPIEPLP